MRSLRCLQGVSDPEKKRKIIGAGFIEVFNDYAKTLEGSLGSLPRFLVQVQPLYGASPFCTWVALDCQTDSSPHSIMLVSAEQPGRR